jgi:hypothetical protein
LLLSEADFFVDEKDLQTFVGAAFQPRFFLPAFFTRGSPPSCPPPPESLPESLIGCKSAGVPAVGSSLPLRSAVRP